MVYRMIFHVLDIVKLLLEHKASAKEKNLSGWSSLNEAISYGSREISINNYELITV